MRFVKWTVFFLLSFFVSWVLIVTFSQEQFKAFAPIKIVTHSTREFPLYYYPIATFAIGLVLGLVVAVYNYITLRSKLHGANKKLKEAQRDADHLRQEVADASSAIENDQEHQPETQRLPAPPTPPTSPEEEDEFLDKDDSAAGSEDEVSSGGDSEGESREENQ